MILIINLKPIPIFKWIMLNWASHAHFSPFSNGLCQIGPLMPTLDHFQMDYAELGLSCPLWPIFKWIMSNWVSHAYYGPLRWTLVLFKGFTTYLIRLESFLHTSVSWSPIDKRNQANNLRKRNSPLNTHAEDIRVEISFESFGLLCVMCK